MSKYIKGTMFFLAGRFDRLGLSERAREVTVYLFPVDHYILLSKSEDLLKNLGFIA